MKALAGRGFRHLVFVLEHSRRANTTYQRGSEARESRAGYPSEVRSTQPLHPYSRFCVCRVASVRKALPDLLGVPGDFRHLPSWIATSGLPVCRPWPKLPGLGFAGGLGLAGSRFRVEGFGCDIKGRSGWTVSVLVSGPEVFANGAGSTQAGVLRASVPKALVRPWHFD